MSHLKNGLILIIAVPLNHRKNNSVAAISNYSLHKIHSASNTSLENDVYAHALISLKGLPTYCPIKAGLFWGSIVLVCSVAIAISISAQIDLIYSSFWVLFSALATFLFLTKNKPQESNIHFTQERLEICCGERKIASKPLAAIRKESFCWTNDDGLALPAIKIKGSKLKTLSIGLTVEDDEWLSYWNTIKQPDVLISDIDEWHTLISLLQCE